MERLEQELRVVRQRFGDDVQNLWNIDTHGVHPEGSVRRSSEIILLCKMTIEKLLQANVHGSGATPMDVDALAKTKGGKKGGKGKDKESETKKFDGHCFWCGAYGRVMKDCRKNAAGKPKTAQSPRTSEPKAKGKGKGGQGKKGASSLDEWPDGQEEQPSSEKSGEEVASLFMGAVDRREEYDRREKYNRREKCNRRVWQAWERILKQARQQWESYKARNLGANSVVPGMGERIDLTIDSGCAVLYLLGCRS